MSLPMIPNHSHRGNSSRTAILPTALFLASVIAMSATTGSQAAPAPLDAIIAPDAVVEKVLDGYNGVEGPIFSRLGYWLYSDEGNDRIWKLKRGDTDPTIWREKSNGARGLFFDRQGRLLACETTTRRVTRTEKDGAISILADQFDGHRLNGPDDLVHAIDGSTYFTDPATGRLPKGEKFEQKYAAVYQIMRDGELRAVATDFKSPNGLALSANHQKLFVSDSAANHIRVFNLEGDGRLVGGEVFAKLPAAGGSAGGIETDLDGNVYCTGPGGIWVFDKGGRHLGTIAVPEAPSNIGWGDDYRTLYVAAQTTLYRIKLKKSGTRIY